MAASIPIILCGKSPQVASVVKKNLMPEYDVIHIILTPQSGISEIPSLLSSSPSSPSSISSSNNTSNSPKAVVTGAGYDEEAVEKMRRACGGSQVPWLMPDTSIPTPPLGPKYGQAMVRRVKECLRELEEEGRMEGDGVYFY